MTGLARFIATVGGVGLLRPAPGTWGSAAALPLAWGLHVLGGLPALAIGIVVACVTGVWATGVATAGQADKDPGEIVIDELAGQWIALLPLSWAAWDKGLDITVLWPGWISAFVLFRAFDILKPGPVGWADRKGGALGVMLDDVIAGIFAAIGVLILAGLWHGVIAA